MSDCWPWPHAIDRHGYGVKRDGERTVRAHRWVYERLVGPIPEGLDLDHLCRNRACVNPDHLEPVTRAENLSRGASKGGALWTPPTHCKHGHPLTPDNLIPRHDGPRSRCKTCRRDVERRRDARKKGAPT